MRLWEVFDYPNRRRVSLHHTVRDAKQAALEGGYKYRMRTLPKWLRPFARFVWW